MSVNEHRQNLITRIDEIKKLKRSEQRNINRCELDRELRELASELCNMDYCW